MSILSKVFSAGAGELINKVGGVIDNLHTSAEEKAMESICVDIKEWGENAVKSRAAEAIQNITTGLIDHCNANEIAIATGVEAQIDQAVNYSPSYLESFHSGPNDALLDLDRD